MANIVEVLVKAKDESKGVLKEHQNAVKGIAGAFLGAGAAAASSGLLSMGGPLAAAGVALGAFGAVAAPELSKTQEALAKTGKAGQKAWKELTPPERQLAGAIKGVEASWTKLQATLAPVVDKVVGMGAKLIKDFLPSVGKLAEAGGKIAEAFIGPLDKLVRSKVFSQFIDQLAKFGEQAGKILGPAIVQLLKVFMQLFTQLMPTGIKVLQLLFPVLVQLTQQFSKLLVQLLPSGVQILKILLPLFVQIVTDLVPVIVVVAKAATAVLNWLTQTKLLKPVLLGLLPVILLLIGSTGIGAILIAIGLLVAGIVELSKNWRKIWADIKQWGKDAWEFLTHGWGQFLIPGLTLLVKTVEFVRDHWRSVWNTITRLVDSARNTIINIFNALRNTMSSVWNSIWNNTVTRVRNGIGDVVSWVRGLPGKLLSALGNAGNTLYGWGKGVINGLWNGIKNIWNSTISWFKGLPTKILGALGIKSPPDWAISAGSHIMHGILLGLGKKHPDMLKHFSQIVSGLVSGAATFIPGGGILASLGMNQLLSSMMKNLLGKGGLFEGLPKAILGGDIVKDTGQFSSDALAGSVGADWS